MRHLLQEAHSREGACVPGLVQGRQLLGVGGWRHRYLWDTPFNERFSPLSSPAPSATGGGQGSVGQDPGNIKGCRTVPEI